jgi:hypothetical protein
MRLARSVFAITFAGLVARLAFAADPAPVPAKVAPVVMPAKLQAAVDREKARLAPKVTTDQRTKLVKAARLATAEIDAQLQSPKAKLMKSSDVTMMVRKAANDPAAGVDFSNMTIEDAVMLVFMLISDDARKDMKDALEEMDATRKRREALRDAEQKIKEEQAEMKAAARAAFVRERYLKVNDAIATILKVDLTADAGSPK